LIGQAALTEETEMLNERTIDLIHEMITFAKAKGGTLQDVLDGGTYRNRYTVQVHIPGVELEARHCFRLIDADAHTKEQKDAFWAKHREVSRTIQNLWEAWE
jgi:hypothetical protein